VGDETGDIFVAAYTTKWFPVRNSFERQIFTVLGDDVHIAEKCLHCPKPLLTNCSVLKLTLKGFVQSDMGGDKYIALSSAKIIGDWLACS